MIKEWLIAQGDLLKVVETIVKILGVCAGAIWAVLRFGLTRPFVDYPLVTLRVEEQNIDNDLSWLTFCVTVNNMGKKRFTPGPRGIELTVKSFESPFVEGAMPVWSEGKPIIVEEQLLEYAKNTKTNSFDDTYYLEAGIEYLEKSAVCVKQGRMYVVQAGLHTGNDEGDWILVWAYHYSKEQGFSACQEIKS